MAANRAPGRYDVDPPKPRNDAYTGLLSISFVAMLIACLLLLIDWFSFPQQKPPRVALPAVKAVNVPKGGGDPVIKEEMKKDDAKKEEMKKDDAKKEEMKKDDAKKEEMKKDDAKKDDAKKE
jgi:pentapeptide MXKDX repeat protein